MTSLRTFYRQDEALQDAALLSKFTFSHEIGYGGKRKFLTATIDDFWNTYKKKSERNRKFYEIIPSQAHCKLYLDLEFKVAENESKDGRKLLEVLLKDMKITLFEMFRHTVEEDDILILDATTSLKFSLHVIFTKTVFENNSSMGRFISYLKSRLEVRHPGLFDVQNQEKSVSFIDSCVYKKNQNFRLFLSRKMGKENYLLS